MYHTYKKPSFSARLLTLLLSVSMLLTGCSAASDPGTSGKAPEAEASSDAEQQFRQMIDDIFYDTVTESGLTLHSLISSPENYGITEFPETLGDYSLEGVKANYEEMHETLEQLQAIDRDALSEQLRTDYDILMEYLETELPGEDFCLYGYPFSAFSGIQVQLPILLAEYSFRDPEDVDHYLSLLADMDECYGQLLAYVQAQTEAGICLSDLSIDGILDSCQVFLDSPETGMMAETFENRLNELEGLSDEDRSAYLEQNEKILKEDFTAAYQLLTDGLEQLKGYTELPQGASELPNGKAWYEYLLSSSTFTSYESPKALKNAVIHRIRSELQESYELMENTPDLYGELLDLHFSITDPAEALVDLQEKITEDFPEVSEYPYEIRQVPESLQDFSNPAFYLTPPIDSQKQNFIYINPASVRTQEDIYTVMAHEGYPGHLYQCNYFNEVNDSRLRAVMNFSCYVEGWATYVEFLSYHWDDGLSDELASLISASESTSLALYALADYQVNYEGMTLEELEEFLKENFHISSSDAALQMYQIICEDPANYLKYYIGYLEIMEMREEAEQTLGEAFSPKDFHTFLLDFGPAPFSLIRQEFSQWISQIS